MSETISARELSLGEVDNARLANFTGPMEQNLRQKFPEVLKLPIQRYFKKWEVLYMTGQLTPGSEVAELCQSEYQAVAAVWGDFDTE